MALPDGAVQIFASYARFTTLDQNGFVAAGAATYGTSSLIKCTFTPNLETGVDLVQVNANGDIAAHFKHGDMPKYYDAAIQLTTNDPVLHAMLTGGTVFTSAASALGTPTGTLVCTPYTTLSGTLAAGVYGYRVSQTNQYGETTAMAEVTATTTGSTGSVVVSGAAGAAGTQQFNVYGRTSGGEQLMASYAYIGVQATGAASGTGTVTSLTVTALTKPIPLGYTFFITGDTNTPKVIWTTTAAAGTGATALSVSASASVTITIAAANIVPCYVDSGAAVPFGTPPGTDTTAGPGVDTGWQAPALAIVGNPYGVSCELWAKAVLNGTQASLYPWYRWAIPKVANLREDAREFSATMQLPTYMGQAFENPNWSTGPFGDWQFDSTKVYQYTRAGTETVPIVGLGTVPATY